MFFTLYGSKIKSGLAVRGLSYIKPQPSWTGWLGLLGSHLTSKNFLLKRTEQGCRKKRSKMHKWIDDLIENLVNTLHDFKTKMNFRGWNFDSNFEIRKVIAAIYGKEDTSLFGVLESRIFDLNEKDIESLSEEEIKKIKIDITEHNSDISRDRNRVPQEIKDIRQNFSSCWQWYQIR